MEFELTTTEAVIDALGGNQRVGELTASNAKAVWNWRASNTFPSNTYVALQSALKSIGKAAPDALWSMKPAVGEPERAA
jgi:hypothetical protein